jgi:hypothetical protein
VGVVDHAQDRRIVVCGLRERGEGGDADEERLDRRPVLEAESNSQRSGLRWRQAVEGGEGAKQTVQRGIRQRGLGLDAGSAQRANATLIALRLEREQVAQQRGLPDPGLSQQDEDGGGSGAGLLDQSGKLRAFPLAAV